MITVCMRWARVQLENTAFSYISLSKPAQVFLEAWGPARPLMTRHRFIAGTTDPTPELQTSKLREHQEHALPAPIP